MLIPTPFLGMLIPPSALMAFDPFSSSGTHYSFRFLLTVYKLFPSSDDTIITQNRLTGLFLLYIPEFSRKPLTTNSPLLVHTVGRKENMKRSFNWNEHFISVTKRQFQYILETLGAQKLTHPGWKESGNNSAMVVWTIPESGLHK